MILGINLLKFNVELNWLMIYLSLLLMIIINIIRRKKYGYNIFQAIMISVFVNIFAILGAIIMYNLENFQGKFSLGFSFYGTVFLLPVFMFLFSFLFPKKNKRLFFNYWALTIPMELALFRISCHFNGCCIGIISNWGIQYPFDMEGILRLPVQLIEVVFDFAIFITLIKYERNNYKDGKMYFIFMILYSMIRFILEYYRDTAKSIIGMSNGQIFSFIALLLGVLFMYILSKNNEKNL